jgi:PAS domain-containing protein
MVVQRHEVRNPDADGGFEVRYWSPVNSPVLKEDGSLAYIIHRIENVTDFVLLKEQGTERKEVEEGLRKSERRLKVAVQNAAFLPAECDRELRYTWIYNPHPDFDPQQVIGKQDIELDQSEGAQRLFDLKRQVLASETGTREEIEFIRSNGLHVYDIRWRRSCCT